MRILAMLMIIDVHFFGACNAQTITVPWSGNYWVFHVMESLGICGVNLFVLITGYFSLQQESVKIRKMVNLLLDVAFWGGIGVLLCVAVGWKSFQLKEMIKIMFPIIFGGRWYVRAYIVLICLIPFINVVLHSITKESYRTLLIIMALFLSVWPSFLPNPPLDDYGYGFVHFVFLYTIAGYIRLYVNRYPPRWLCLLCYFGSAAVVCISSMVGRGCAWAYDYVFVITEAVSLLLLFAQINVQSAVINKIAACAFGVFLIHTDGFFSNLIYSKLLHCNELVTGNAALFLLSAFASLPIFYCIGFILESIKKKLFLFSIDRWLDKVAFINAIIDIKTIKK